MLVGRLVSQRLNGMARAVMHPPAAVMFLAVFVLAFLVTWVEHRDLATAINADVEQEKSQSCGRLGMPPEAAGYPACIRELSGLIRRDQEIRASSGLF